MKRWIKDILFAFSQDLKVEIMIKCGRPTSYYFFEMDTVKPNCIICGSPATHKLHDEVREGFFYVCEKQECKKLLEQQLTGGSKNLN